MKHTSLIKSYFCDLAIHTFIGTGYITLTNANSCKTESIFNYRLHDCYLEVY